MLPPAASLAPKWSSQCLAAWDRFWFAPARPHTLALLRILGGSMLLYTHLAWTVQLGAFLGRDAWVDRQTAMLLNQGADGRSYAWSYLYYEFAESPAVLWTLHAAALVVLAMFAAGLFTRVTSILSFVITLSYCHRLTGSLFGLDQINLFLVMYLMLAPSGSVWSLDRWLALRRQPKLPDPPPATMTNVAMRLLQVHLCVVYLFGGIGKARGDLWWDGSAVWFAIANLEYQSLDVTWLVHWPWLVALLTHVTLFWELFYPVLIWPRLTRPVFLALAFAVHGGIALALGMKTFGLAMIIANLVFLSPDWLAQAADRFRGASELPGRSIG